MLDVYGLFVLFCKQKTAYEMRISDWSSDVCSSDLGARHGQRPSNRARPGPFLRNEASPVFRSSEVQMGFCNSSIASSAASTPSFAAIRSEEHTSELQSLMRISYAVFCLKTKKQKTLITVSRRRTNDRKANKHSER